MDKVGLLFRGMSSWKSSYTRAGVRCTSRSLSYVLLCLFGLGGGNARIIHF